MADTVKRKLIGKKGSSQTICSETPEISGVEQPVYSLKDQIPNPDKISLGVDPSTINKQQFKVGN